MNEPVLAIIVPCFNEQKLIQRTIQKLLAVLNKLSDMKKISNESFLYLVDDGSRDKTWQIIDQLHKENPNVKGLKLMYNFGNQNALLAGFLNVKKFNPDCIITIDADLQQDENAIGLFVEKYLNGADIVCGIRNDRNADKFFKKHSALLFYKLMRFLGIKLAVNHSDYRLISRRVLDILPEYGEVNLFLRGIFHELGVKKDYVYFDVKPRPDGKSRYKLKSLICLALNGITSFSVVPLRMVAVLGILIALFSFGLGLEAIFEKYILKSVLPGWTTIVVAISFIGGIQIFCTGIIGEYLGQVYREVKARPRFIKDIEII